jgi:DMSO/TMAO reductase YedYZ molybdopterin-dependent catalytic subunit
LSVITPGFHGRRPDRPERLPPGQFETTEFPVLSAGPTPRIPLDRWRLTVNSETGESRSWSWAEFQALPVEEPVVDIHCVTRWSKFDTTWRGVPISTLLDGIGTSAEYAMVHSYGGYTTNLPLADLLDRGAWVVHSYAGRPLPAEHGGPARLLVPHLYLWKSAKWIDRIDLMVRDRSGFWEGLGYHDYGDPWREQRYQGD